MLTEPSARALRSLLQISACVLKNQTATCNCGGTVGSSVAPAVEARPEREEEYVQLFEKRLSM